jgi:hypothetical protein
LGAIVQIAFEPSPRIIAGKNDPGPGCGELCPGLGMGDGGRKQVRKLPHPCLDVRGQRLGPG